MLFLAGMPERTLWSRGQLKRILEHVDVEASKLDNAKTVLRAIVHYRQEVLEFSSMGRLRYLLC